MFKRAILIFILSIAAILASEKPTAHAAPVQDYNYTYNLTNLYTNYTLQYSFTSLDTATEYIWTIEKISLDGSPQGTIAKITRSGSMSADWSFNAWGNLKDTPFRVHDNFGRILGRHFLAQDVSGSAYATQDGQTTTLNRTEIRKINAIFSDSLVTNNGAIIDGLPCCSASILQQYTTDQISALNAEYISVDPYVLIHYRVDPTFSDTTLIDIKDLATGVTVMSTDLQEMIDYNTGGGLATANDEEYADFIVLGSTGHCPFCDPVLSVASFPSTNIPMYRTLPVGSYEYARRVDPTGANTIYAGEYLFSLGTAVNQFNVQVSPQITKQNYPTTAIFRMADAAIWDALRTSDIFLTLTEVGTGLNDCENLLEGGAFLEVRCSFMASDLGTQRIVWIQDNFTGQFFQSNWRLAYISVGDFAVNTGSAINNTNNAITGILTGFGVNDQFTRFIIYIVLLLISFALAAIVRGDVIVYELFFLVITIGLMLIGWFALAWAIILGCLCGLITIHMFTEAISGSRSSNAG